MSYSLLVIYDGSSFATSYLWYVYQVSPLVLSSLTKTKLVLRHIYDCPNFFGIDSLHGQYLLAS